MSDFKYDVAIVGASLSGATAANILGSKGLNVAVFDKSQFPRRKACGEGLSRKGIAVLNRLGIPEEPDQPIFKGYKIYIGNQSTYIKSPDGGGIGVERKKLDFKLIESAKKFGSINWHIGEEVCELTKEGSISSGNKTFFAKNIIVASGANPKFYPSKISNNKKLKRIGVSATFIGDFYIPQNQISIFIKDTYEIYCTPISKNKLNVCILSSIDNQINGKRLIQSQEIQDLIFSKIGFIGKIIEPPIGKSQLGNSRRISYSGQILFVGDSVEQFDPLGGMGMSHALLSGELAAKAIIDINSSKSTQQEGFRWYAEQREKISLPMRRFTLLCQHMFNTSRKIPPLVHLASSPIGQFVMKIAERN